MAKDLSNDTVGIFESCLRDCNELCWKGERSSSSSETSSIGGGSEDESDPVAEGGGGIVGKDRSDIAEVGGGIVGRDMSDIAEVGGGIEGKDRSDIAEVGGGIEGKDRSAIAMGAEDESDTVAEVGGGIVGRDRSDTADGEPIIFVLLAEESSKRGREFWPRAEEGALLQAPGLPTGGLWKVLSPTFSRGEASLSLGGLEELELRLCSLVGKDGGSLLREGGGGLLTGAEDDKDCWPV